MTEVNDKKRIFRSIVFDTTFIIGIVTVFFYISAYRFEAGRKEFYHIPNKLTEINLLTIIRSNIPFTATLIFIAIALIVYFVCIYTLAFLVNKYISKKFDAKRYIELKDFPLALKYITILVVVAMLITSYSQAFNFGKISASDEKEFWTLEKGGSVYAVIDTYNNNFLLVPINVKKSTYKLEYTFINPVDEKIKFKRTVLQEALHEE